MKTSILSTGTTIQIILEPENPLEKSIIESMDLYHEKTKTNRDNNNLIINIETK